MRPKMSNKSASESFSFARNSAPVTLTPTSLKCLNTYLEQDVMNCTSEDSSTLEDMSCIPEVITTSGSRTFVNLDAVKSWGGGTTTILTPTSMVPSTILDRFKEELIDKEQLPIARKTEVERRPKRKATSRRTGGRKPTNVNKNGEELSPEEEGRLNVRRERNKQAAARCRKRRVDQTNDLSEQVEGEETIKRTLQDQIQALTRQKEEMEFLLEAHRNSCKSGKDNSIDVVIKSEPVIVESATDIYPSFQSVSSRRPMSLNLNIANSSTDNPAGIAIETPSCIIPSLSFSNFDNVFLESTGLTPISTSTLITPFMSNTLNTPTCSTQQRSIEDISSNDSGSPNLVSL